MTEATSGPRLGLREITRASVREQIADRSLQMFDERGFDATTVDDIAAAIGISARSFFRYFPAKEDVVIGDPTALGQAVRDAAAARPVDEPLWATLRRAFDPVQLTTVGDEVRGLRIMRVMMSTPTLRARNLEKHILWARQLEPLVESRVGGPVDTRRFRAQTLIHAALACLDVAFAEWTARDGEVDIADLLDEAFGTLRH
ncbi:MAG: transcriptional regulator, tetR family [Glaciihabitans sp.]|nr:transcriptional regulator, tetR family [Glaciihabitans sp.]